jgi:hypothetical protein
MDILFEDLCSYLHVSKGNHLTAGSEDKAVDLYLGGVLF